MDHVDVVVVGAGVVGLACARALALAGREVLLLEAEANFGTGISSRNSEVIHAGLYYPNGSLKARHCVAANNGVDDLQLMTAADAAAREPALRCLAALLSPSSGIVDSHSLMLSLRGDLENAGGTAVFNTPVTGGRVEDGGLLASMNRRARMQLRLQQTVEGLSIAAITYFVVGLVGNAAKALKEAGVPLSVELVTGTSIPFVALAIWLAVRRLRKNLGVEPEAIVVS